MAFLLLKSKYKAWLGFYSIENAKVREGKFFNFLRY